MECKRVLRLRLALSALRRALKHNNNHDERGRFSSGGAGAHASALSSATHASEQAARAGTYTPAHRAAFDAALAALAADKTMTNAHLKEIVGHVTQGQIPQGNTRASHVDQIAKDYVQRIRFINKLKSARADAAATPWRSE